MARTLWATNRFWEWRALNSMEKDWPDTLIGRRLQAFEFWRDHLQPQGYGLKAMILD
ncbi:MULTISPECIES: hypothetical protein [unclassified Afipia]|uniref:hypothetical protein n=1 Tax=unclassified Afipia TaxID=2642050 RepID=UPI000414058E|nr:MULTISPECIES: hypothetical protein [unclassified Afipia]